MAVENTLLVVTNISVIQKESSEAFSLFIDVSDKEDKEEHKEVKLLNKVP